MISLAPLNVCDVSDVSYLKERKAIDDYGQKLYTYTHWRLWRRVLNQLTASVHLFMKCGFVDEFVSLPREICWNCNTAEDIIN